MADLARIKRNVAKMASMNAPEEDIDGYIASEGVTIEDVRNYRELQPMTDEQKAQAREMAQQMRPEKTLGDKVSEFLVTNPIARQVGFGLQGISNASLNPAGYVARAAGIDTKPLEAQTAGERATELAGQYGFDAAAIVPTLGLAASSAPAVAPYVAPLVEGGVPLALTGSTGSALATGIINPESTVGRIATDILGGGLSAGLTRPKFTAPKQDVKTVKELTKSIDEDALNRDIAEAERTGRNLLEVGGDEVMQAAQQARQQSPEARKIITDTLESSIAEQPTRTRGVINEALGTKGKNSTIAQVMENAKAEAQPIYKELENIGDLAAYETKDIPEQNFKRWFEGSKIVDENGQPRRYYHGSLRNFDKFKQGNNDYNFAPDEKFAYNYAENKAFEQGIDAEPKVYEVFLKSKKPFDFENPQDIQNLSDYIGNKAIKVFGNPKEKNDFLSNLKGEYYDTDLRKGEFEKLFDENAFYPYNWYDGTNKIVDQTYSSMSDSRIFKVNPNEEYFIAGSLPYGYDIRDINKKQVEDAIKNLDFNKFKKQQIPVDIQTEYGNRVVNLDLKRIDKPSIKNLKKGGDNWVTIESADFDGEDLIDALKKMGYDGYYKQENGTKNLSVFSPDQIKSVNNSGAWSSSPSLSDAGWKPESQLANVIKNNDVLADTISRVKRANSSLKNLPDTDFKVVNEARKALSQASMNRTELSGYEAREALKELDPILNNITGGKLAQANKLYSDAYQFERAADLGRDVFNSRKSPDDLKAAWNSLSSTEKQAAKIGLREEVMNKIGSATNETNALNRFLPENVREKITTIAGNKEGGRIIDEAEQAVKLRRNYNKLTSGSQTPEKQSLRDTLSGIRGFVRKPWETTVDVLAKPFDTQRNIRMAEYLTENPASLKDAFNRVNIANRLNAERMPRRTPYLQSALRAIIEEK